MKKRFIFDVDGTLTPSRQAMDPGFKAWFLDFMKREKVWLVTGSDYPKTVEQLGKDICENVVTCYSCSGNQTRFLGKVVNASSFDPDPSLTTLLEGWLQSSPFPLRTGNHIEKRVGTWNFSVVGRNADTDQRAEYVEYDKLNRERESIAYQINSEFKNITATVGGDTGIDIYNTGSDKSQILDDFNNGSDHIVFFGDKTEIGGNDYPLAKAIKHPGKTYQVDDWKHTWKILKDLQ